MVRVFLCSEFERKKIRLFPFTSLFFIFLSLRMCFTEETPSLHLFCRPRQYAKPQEMDHSQHTGLQASIGLGGASARLLGEVSNRPENNVLCFLAGIAYRLILQELEPNGQYHHNSCSSRDLQKLAT